MNTTKVIVWVAMVAIAAIGGYFVWQSWPSIMQTGILADEEKQITVFDTEIALSAVDAAIAAELDQTLADADDMYPNAGSGAFDETSINQEVSAIDASQEFDASTDGTGALEELDATVNEVSQ